MGVYELPEGNQVNARGVRKRTGQGWFMYYASSDKWYIGSREGIEAGKTYGWLCVASTALTPDKITEMWQVPDGTGTWPDALKVRARLA